eukprot:756617-Alexandrium_andersonii.AAC.1
MSHWSALASARPSFKTDARACPHDPTQHLLEGLTWSLPSPPQRAFCKAAEMSACLKWPSGFNANNANKTGCNKSNSAGLGDERML